jgi:hypothetical protein
MARSAVLLGGLLIVLLLDVAASVRVGRWDVVTSSQKPLEAFPSSTQVGF